MGEAAPHESRPCARAIAEAEVPLLGMSGGKSLTCLNHLLHRGEEVNEVDGVNGKGIA